MWMEYLGSDYEQNIFHRQDFYLAQIACEIRRTITKNPKAVKLKDFIIDFVKKTVKKKRTSYDVEKSKSFWFAGLGIKDKKKC